MNLEDWKESGWLREHKTSAQEIKGIMALVERDITDAERKEISTDWRFNIAYNACLQLVTALLYASGYGAGRGESKHYRTIQALPLILGSEFVPVKDYLDSCRRKRNISEYDAAGMISEKEAEDLLTAARKLKDHVENWLERYHPVEPGGTPVKY
jgi:uncharacterized protein (UPF0332 family)